jgi:hypothetical protein
MTRRLPFAYDLKFPLGVSMVVAALLAVNSIVGLTYGPHGLYRPDRGTLPTFIGQDAITLLVGLPLLIASMWLTRRGSLRGLLVWLGALVYVAYSYAYYLISPEFNILYLGYILIVSMSGYCLLYLLLGIDAQAVRSQFSRGTPVRLVGGFLALMALLMTFKWVSSIVLALGTQTPPAAKDLGVWPMDLVVAFPAMFWGGIWLWRRHPLGYVVGALLLIKAASVGLTLVVLTWLVTLWGEPPDPMVPVYAAIGLGGIVLSVVYLRHTKVDEPRQQTVAWMSPPRCSLSAWRRGQP